MLQRQADMINKKIAFLDPVAICEKRHYGPMLWNDDHDDFKNCKTRKEILDVRNEAHKKSLGQLVPTYRFRCNGGRTGMLYGHHTTFNKCSLNHLV